MKSEKISATQWFYFQNEDKMDVIIEKYDDNELDDLKDDKKKLESVIEKLRDDNKSLLDAIMEKFKSIETGREFKSNKSFHKDLSERELRYSLDNVLFIVKFFLQGEDNSFTGTPSLAISVSAWASNKVNRDNIVMEISNIYENEYDTNNWIYSKETFNEKKKPDWNSAPQNLILFQEFKIAEDMKYQDISNKAGEIFKNLVVDYWDSIFLIIKKYSK